MRTSFKLNLIHSIRSREAQKGRDAQNWVDGTRHGVLGISRHIGVSRHYKARKKTPCAREKGTTKKDKLMYSSIMCE